MKALWVTFVVIATLGSIYPFNFSFAHADAAAFAVFMQSCCQRAGIGDIVGNIILFIPVGFTGMFGLFREHATARRFAAVLAGGVGIALVLQLLQFFLPSRDENLQDVAWNGLGLAVGAALAPVLARLTHSKDLHLEGMSLVPISLIGIWLAYRLMPFVPSLDVQNIKNSLKPLLVDIQVSISGILENLAAWLVVAYLLQHVQSNIKRDHLLPLLIAAVLCLEVLIVRNSVGASSVIGAILAVLVWQRYLSSQHQQEGFLVVALLAAIVVSGLQPFVVSPVEAHFNWLPFRGFLGGSMYLNAQSAAEKVFLYGSLVYLLWRTPLHRLAGLAVAVSIVLSLEWAQIYVAGHTPEITDPVLIVFAALALLALERHDAQVPAATPLPPALSPSTAVTFTDMGGGTVTLHRSWTAQTINLRVEQRDFLESIAAEMGGSASGVARRIVGAFMDEFSDDGASLGRTGIHSKDDGATNLPPEGAPAWRQQIVNLKPAQMIYLDTLSATSGYSISKIVRRTIQRFMDGLDDS